jgi:hypothetical protein
MVLMVCFCWILPRNSPGLQNLNTLLYPNLMQVQIDFEPSTILLSEIKILEGLSMQYLRFFVFPDSRRNRLDLKSFMEVHLEEKEKQDFSSAD